MAILIQAGETTDARQRAYFHCVDATDGLTPETGEAAGQPQISTDGGAFTNTGIGTLTHMGNGRYYATLTDAAVASVALIESRYKSAATAEAVGTTVQVVAFDPDDAVSMGMTALPSAAADGVGGLPISDAGGLDLDTLLGYLTAPVALASVATEGRLAELDAANIPADVDTLLTRLSAVRAGYLDNLSAGPVALAAGVDVTSISGDATAADNLERVFEVLPAATSMMYMGSHGPGVWIDGGAANTNTVVGTDGIPSNPVSTIAAATTLAGSLGLQVFYLFNATAITLAQAYEGYTFVGLGTGNQVTLGGQDVDNMHAENLTVTGVQGGTGMVQIKRCSITALTGLEGWIENSLLSGAITVRAGTTTTFSGCHSGIPGASTPVLTFGAGVVAVGVRGYLGGLEIASMTADDTMSFDCPAGQFIIAATCSGGALQLRGNHVLTDNSGSVTVTDDARVDRPTVVVDTWDRVLTGATHNIATSAGRRLRGIQDFQGYENGAIWIDTLNGTAGTTDFENGTVENPVLTLADALTLNTSLGLNRFHIANGSTITLSAASDNYTLMGENWTLALGGQSISGAAFEGAVVSGTGTGAAQPQFRNCQIGTVTLPPSHFENCGLSSTFTMGSAGDFFFNHCESEVAGTSTPILDFGAGLAASNVGLRGYDGGIEIQNMGAGAGSYNMSFEGDGQLIVNANCSATSTIALRGAIDVTNNASGITISDDARYDVAQINAQVDAALNTAIPGGPTADSINERLAAVDDLTQASGAGDLAALWTRIQAVSDADSVILDATQRTAIGDAVAAIDLAAGSVDYELVMHSGATIGAMLAMCRAVLAGKMTAPAATQKQYTEVDAVTDGANMVHASDYTTRNEPTRP